MISCIKTALITLHLFGGGEWVVRAESIESVQETECREITDMGGMFSSIKTKTSACRFVLMKSGKYEKVTESVQEVKNLMESNNGK